MELPVLPEQWVSAVQPEQRVLQALTVLPVPLVSLVYLVRRVPLALALRVQPVLQVFQERPAPPGSSA